MPRSEEADRVEYLGGWGWEGGEMEEEEKNGEGGKKLDGNSDGEGERKENGNRGSKMTVAQVRSCHSNQQSTWGGSTINLGWRGD